MCICLPACAAPSYTSERARAAKTCSSDTWSLGKFQCAATLLYRSRHRYDAILMVNEPVVKRWGGGAVGLQQQRQRFGLGGPVDSSRS